MEQKHTKSDKQNMTYVLIAVICFIRALYLFECAGIDFLQVHISII